MSPEPPDPMDDVLDELLHGADEDLQDSLGQALDIPRGRDSITSPQPVDTTARNYRPVRLRERLRVFGSAVLVVGLVIWDMYRSSVDQPHDIVFWLAAIF